MSLDFYLYGKEETKECTCVECGHSHTKIVPDMLFQANITHNLGKMAEKAGIYKVLWKPVECGFLVAGDIIVPLEKGLRDMEKNPTYYRTFNSPNGWGVYDHFLPFVREVLGACKKFPHATIYTSR